MQVLQDHPEKEEDGLLGVQEEVLCDVNRGEDSGEGGTAPEEDVDDSPFRDECHAGALVEIV